MKPSYLIISLFFANFSLGQGIEQISTDNDAITFLRNKFPALDSFRYSESTARDFPEDKKWGIADFDKNGNPDLLITGTIDGVKNMAYVVLTGGDNQHTLKDLTPGGYFLIPVSVIKNIGGENVIILHQSVNTKKWSDTLTHKFGVFLKYNSSVQARKFTLLHYGSTGCLGGCPVYKLIIDSSSSATLEVTSSGGLNFQSTDSLTGTYYSKLTRARFNELTELINYLNLSSLNNHYSVSITDLPTGIIEIVFTDGSFKRIDDYGKVGTPALRAFHEYLDKLRFSESWKK